MAGIWRVVLLLMLPASGLAAPVAVTERDGVTITATDEPCRLTAMVDNLPMRATWQEKGKTFEGCFVVHPMGIVLFYFEDKTIVAVPPSAFRKTAAI